MLRGALIGLLALCILYFGACGKPPYLKDLEQSIANAPHNLVLEREISGNILGQNLGDPCGVAADRRGFLYVTDGANHRVIRFNADLQPEDAVGGRGRAVGLFDHPGDIAVDWSGNSFICDMDNSRLVRLDVRLRQNLEIVLSDVTEALKFGEASGVAVSDNAEIWMTDRERNRIAVFDLTGQFQRFSGDIEAGKGALSGPTGIAYYRKLGFIVCDTDNRRLAYFDTYGNYLFDLRLDMSPTAVAVDYDGNAWVLDGSSGQMAYVVQSSTGARLGGPVLVGIRDPLNRASDFTVLGRDLLAVADTGNNRIVILRIIRQDL